MLNMKPITDFNQLDLSGYYTYADYLSWQFQERVELILGKIFRISPAPNSKHQNITMVISASLFHYLKGKPCKVFPAPFDVVLPIKKNGVADTVVQPDVTVICDPSKITEQGCEGAPDLVVEIVSKSSVTRDLHEKYSIYEKAGVNEYWIVHPLDKTLIIFTLSEGKYQPSKPLTKGDIAASKILMGFTLDLNELFIDLVEEPEEDYSMGNRIIS
jgi:Uma2 family endonuclease